MSIGVQHDYEVVIGLEVHLQLQTASKVFCGCANRFGAEPNTLTCPVCLGFPGALPVVNQKAIEYAVKVGLALNCEINTFIKFDRKNYFYPDCPKAYQISQYDRPVAYNGFLMIPTSEGLPKRIRIHRAHLEEDAGKLTHDPQTGSSLVDYNRTGTPLMEIVTEPDLRSAQEAYDYLQALKLTLRYLDVSDCDMEKGSLRCDANVSIRPVGQETLGTKTELKNMNSFKAVKAALEFEIARQRQVVTAGDKVVQETRLWDENKMATFSMRSKEDAHDYRYFPDPDLVPVVLQETAIEAIRATLPESPDKKKQRLVEQYALSEYDAQILIQDRALADFFEACASTYPQIKRICNWINGPLLMILKERKTDIAGVRLTPINFVALLRQVDEDVVSQLAAKDVLRLMVETGKDPLTIIEDQGLAQVSDDAALERLIQEILEENPKAVTQIKDGKQNAIGFLIGQAMRKSRGKANPKKVGALIQRMIEKM